MSAGITIKLKRGLRSHNTNVVLKSGEPFYDTNEKALYVGDGSTILGNLSPMTGDTTTIVNNINNLTAGPTIAMATKAKCDESGNEIKASYVAKMDSVSSGDQTTINLKNMNGATITSTTIHTSSGGSGPTGPTGATGATGAPGPKGDTGTRGSKWIKAKGNVFSVTGADPYYLAKLNSLVDDYVLVTEAYSPATSIDIPQGQVLKCVGVKTNYEQYEMVVNIMGPTGPAGGGGGSYTAGYGITISSNQISIDVDLIPDKIELNSALANKQNLLTPGAGIGMGTSGNKTSIYNTGVLSIGGQSGALDGRLIKIILSDVQYEVTTDGYGVLGTAGIIINPGLYIIAADVSVGTDNLFQVPFTFYVNDATVVPESTALFVSPSAAFAHVDVLARIQQSNGRLYLLYRDSNSTYTATTGYIRSIIKLL